jgi:V-type H+-transporting ATPase subunit a
MRAHDHGNSFGEMMIHQMIETIEFVLGTVSNTASYLRLWALSLAHGQLAEVFFNLIFKYALTTGSMPLTIVIATILWPAFWTVTFAVLMCMDCLECFLHTLRLHWVEFQNKFFKGEGYPFVAFKYQSILKGVLDDPFKK